MEPKMTLRLIIWLICSWFVFLLDLSVRLPAARGTVWDAALLNVLVDGTTSVFFVVANLLRSVILADNTNFTF